jgi:CTP synthase
MAAKSKPSTKYIFVVGGVLSGLGKGITAASIGKSLAARSLSVNMMKCDPYLNVDAGTLNPAEHGECFVTSDGAETDLDLGHYERFLDRELDRNSSLMSGRVLSKLIEDERRGDYLGKTVQIIPHVTEAIQDYIEQAGDGFDVHIVEVGGTIGDYESLGFIEAIREFSARVGAENCLYVEVVYVPYLGASKEFKTKPAQNAVRGLRGLGITPDVLIVRSEEPAPEYIIDKLSSLTGINKKGIALLPNARTVYEVPLTLEKFRVNDYIIDQLGLKNSVPDLKLWRQMVKTATTNHKPEVTVGIIAKYMDNEDTYMSVFEALRSAAWKHQLRVNIEWVNSEELKNSTVGDKLKGLDGIVIPGGFGSRGVEGKIIAADYSLKSKLPYLGLCLGMQVGVIALARQHIHEGHVQTAEIEPLCEHPVIHLMEHQRSITEKGGTMRLGNYTCVLKKGTRAYDLYGKVDQIDERHRHRFEFNNDYKEMLEEKGLIISGESPNSDLVEMIEMKNHPFFIATQFHPEFKSRPERPHPLFDGFIAELKRKR